MQWATSSLCIFRSESLSACFPTLLILSYFPPVCSVASWWVIFHLDSGNKQPSLNFTYGTYCLVQPWKLLQQVKLLDSVVPLESLSNVTFSSTRSSQISSDVQWKRRWLLKGRAKATGSSFTRTNRAFRLQILEARPQLLPPLIMRVRLIPPQSLKCSLAGPNYRRC